LLPTILRGWEDYQGTLIKAVGALDSDQLNLRVSPDLRSVGQILAHIVGARARWFYLMMGEGGEEFEKLGHWGRGEPVDKSVGEYVDGLLVTWKKMQEIMGRWTEEDWEMTWPGKDEFDPELVTRQWVIWHLMEHDVHHGGEISLSLGAHGLRGLEL
jgi:uncharacterized damage-inducible protein DinB